MILVVGGGGKSSVAALHCAQVRPFTGVGTDVNLTDVGCREGTVTTLKRTFEGTLS